MQRFKLTVAYVGTKFYGWQRQIVPGVPELRTIQRELETLASRIVEQKVNVHASGRTDTGVHADAQVAHMDVPLNKTKINWIRAFNAQLPQDVAISKIELVPPTFHAQYSAVSKLYSYSLWLRADYTPPRLAPFVWACGPLNLEAMQEAAKHMVGRHDFATFKNIGAVYKTTVRNMEKVAMLPQSEQQPLLCVWQFQADGFLKQMVRNMMGLLVAVGRGKIAVDKVPKILEAKDRRASAATAPPSGLTLSQVFYNDTTRSC